MGYDGGDGFIHTSHHQPKEVQRPGFGEKMSHGKYKSNRYATLGRALSLDMEPWGIWELMKWIFPRASLHTSESSRVGDTTPRLPIDYWNPSPLMRGRPPSSRGNIRFPSLGLGRPLIVLAMPLPLMHWALGPPVWSDQITQGCVECNFVNTKTMWFTIYRPPPSQRPICNWGMGNPAASCIPTQTHPYTFTLPNYRRCSIRDTSLTPTRGGGFGAKPTQTKPKPKLSPDRVTLGTYQPKANAAKHEL